MAVARNLKLYFPMIRSRQEILDEISSRKDLREIFESWTEEQQKYFLDVCTGVKGVKILYDAFFKEILNPDLAPERLEELISLTLNQKVRILKVLPNDTSRIAEESSLLIMDIVVEMEDGSIANVECQKMGYAFPGQRAACYSADLLLRQYKRVRGEKGKAFTYRDIKKVYTIIFYEKSPGKFHKFPDNYLHKSKQKTDTGLDIELLQEYVFLPLDIFLEIRHNKGIRNKLEAWLTFLGSDEPDIIIELIDAYPEFRPMYENVYELCCNIEKVMGMFSKELQQLDKNTVQYMMDEMQDTIDKQSEELADKDAVINEQLIELESLRKQITDLQKKQKSQ